MTLGTRALDVGCDACLAVAGQRCTDWQRKIIPGYHQDRIDAAVKQTRDDNRAARSAR